jgi:hypothetical protein
MLHAVSVTPSDPGSDPDTGVLPAGSDWLSFTNYTTPVAMRITTLGGEVVSILLPSGMWPIRAKRVWATGTTTGANGIQNIVCYWT